MDKFNYVHEENDNCCKQCCCYVNATYQMKSNQIYFTNQIYSMKDIECKVILISKSINISPGRYTKCEIIIFVGRLKKQ